MSQGPFMRSEVENDETELTGMRDVENKGKFHYHRRILSSENMGGRLLESSSIPISRSSNHDSN